MNPAPYTLTTMDTLDPSRRRLLGGLAAVAVAGVLAALLGPIAFGADSVVADVSSPVALLAALVLLVLRARFVAEDRRAWIAFAAGVACWNVGSLLYQVWLGRLDPVPFPSVVDACWLGTYIGFYVVVGLLLRGQVRGTRQSFWLDGAIVALGVGSVAAAFLFRDVLQPEGSSPAAMAVNLAYPIADLALVGMVGGIFSVTAWRPGPVWGALAAAFVVQTAVDAYYLGTLANDTYVMGGPMDALWPATMVFVACAAWLRPGHGVEYQSRGIAEVLTPSLVSAVCVGVLVLDHFHHVGLGAVILAAATLLIVGVRAAMTVLEVASLAVSRREALTDELTGLPNRRAFMRTLDEAVKSGRPIGMLLVDLDDFKEINDTLGHATGDAFLCRLGQRMAAAVREGDVLARLGGDEFALITSSAGEEGATRVAERLYRAASGAVVLPEVTVHVEASIGVALIGRPAGDAPTLLRCADVAMYHAKESRRRWSFYSSEHDPHSPERLRVQAELRAAIDDGQLCLLYQPKATLASGTVDGVEALVRWRHPQRGLLTPDRFLPMAERSGLMRDLTLAVLDLALAQAARWAAGGRPLGVAVNLSPSSLNDTSLVGDVSAALERHGVPARMLTLEITESAMMADVPRAIEVLSELKEIGVSIALDDFGTGHASLAHLKHLPVDELKVDRSFVHQMAVDPRDAAIVRLTVELARNLGLRVVAEGIEDLATWDELLLLGCDEAQGYFLSRPVEAAGLDEFLRRPLPATPRMPRRPEAGCPR